MYPSAGINAAAVAAAAAARHPVSKPIFASILRPLFSYVYLSMYILEIIYTHIFPLPFVTVSHDKQNSINGITD